MAAESQRRAARLRKLLPRANVMACFYVDVLKRRRGTNPRPAFGGWFLVMSPRGIAGHDLKQEFQILDASICFRGNLLSSDARLNSMESLGNEIRKRSGYRCGAILFLVWCLRSSLDFVYRKRMVLLRTLCRFL